MNSEDYLSYEHGNVQLLSSASPIFGKLQIIERDERARILWTEYPNHDDSPDQDWALIKLHPRKSFNHQNGDNMDISNRTPDFSCSADSLSSVIVSSNKLDLHLVQRGETLASFKFITGNAKHFLEVLENFVSMKEHPESPYEYILQSKVQAVLDDELASLNLVPNKPSPSRRRRAINHLTAAPKTVFDFLHDMKNDPYNTTVTTISKVYETVLNGYSDEGMPEEESRDFLRRVSGLDDFEPGYELITTTTPLADRPTVDRLTPMDATEFSRYIDESGRITEVEKLKSRVFRGGIHPSVRAKVWPYLLGYYSWGDTVNQRNEHIKKAQHTYNGMKKQWMSISDQQEQNFTSYRERKSLVEKDVLRTDRTQLYYEGDDNPNLIVLNDILMTYVMYNFDLGYVQGMSDLLAPILYVLDDEVAAFWCFVGLMNKMHKNFELTQEGMKDQLKDLTTLLQIVDPEFFLFLQSQDSSNMTFCFRWLLVRFKREFTYDDVMRLWEVLWTGFPCDNFHLLFATAILCSERNELIDNKLAFAEVLKHINDLNYKIDLEKTLREAESIYLQLKATESLPNPVREVLGFPLKSVLAMEAIALNRQGPRTLPGHVERVQESAQEDEQEKCYEDSLLNSFIFFFMFHAE